QAYEMVSNMASYVEKRMSRLSPEAIEKILYTTGANPPNEAGAMNEVLYKLYKVSHNPKHLALAKLFDRNWYLIPLSKNQDILSGLHSNTHIVLVNGFAQRYAITGEALYHNAIQNFWNMLIDHHAYANGSSSGPRPNVVTPTSLTSEHWGVPDHLSNTMTQEIAESCVSHNTQKLTAELFCWNGDPKYADAYMNTFYNSTMALQSAKTGAVVYHLPLGSPRTKKFLKDDDFRCCNGTSIEAFAALNTNIYYHNDSTLWVNMYIPSKVNWQARSFSLEQNGNFPTDSVVQFTVRTAEKYWLSLNLLIPDWSKYAELYINNQKQAIDIHPGSYLSLKRVWKDNDKIRLVFHYDFYLKTMPDDENVFAIFYGPVMLAAETDSEFIVKGSRNEIIKNLTVSGSNVFRLKNGEKTFVLRPLYDINEQSYGVYATIRDY
ncbi:MAG TPA: beta-L-arabinofuranosidase domain-containing protein, partial [Niastella sp.]